MRHTSPLPPRPRPGRRARLGSGSRTLAAASCLVVLAACGGSDSTSGDSAASTDTGDGVLILDDSAAAADDSASGELVVDDSATGAADGMSDSDTSESGSADTATDAAGDLSDEDKALAFADCMRDEGIDWPDPATNADGSIDPLGGLTLRDIAATGDPETIQAAADVCSPLLDGASFLPEDDGLDAATQDSLLEFAQCLRDNGLDVDDPDFSAGAGPDAVGSMFGPDFDPNDPDNSAAIDACSALFAGGPAGG